MERRQGTCWPYFLRFRRFSVRKHCKSTFSITPLSFDASSPHKTYIARNELLGYIFAVDNVGLSSFSSRCRLRKTHVLYNGTGVNAAGDAGDTSPPIFWLEGTSMGISPPILLHTFGHIRPILVALRLRTSRFRSAIRCRQFASVRQADSGLTYCRLYSSALMSARRPVVSDLYRPAFLLFTVRQ